MAGPGATCDFFWRIESEKGLVLGKDIIVLQEIIDLKIEDQLEGAS